MGILQRDLRGNGHQVRTGCRGGNPFLQPPDPIKGVAFMREICTESMQRRPEFRRSYGSKMKAAGQDADHKQRKPIQRDGLAQHALARAEPLLPCFVAQDRYRLGTFLVFTWPEIATEKWNYAQAAEESVAYRCPRYRFGSGPRGEYEAIG